VAVVVALAVAVAINKFNNSLGAKSVTSTLRSQLADSKMRAFSNRTRQVRLLRLVPASSIPVNKLVAMEVVVVGVAIRHSEDIPRQVVPLTPLRHQLASTKAAVRATTHISNNNNNTINSTCIAPNRCTRNNINTIIRLVSHRGRVVKVYTNSQNQCVKFPLKSIKVHLNNDPHTVIALLEPSSVFLLARAKELLVLLPSALAVTTARNRVPVLLPVWTICIFFGTAVLNSIKKQLLVQHRHSRTQPSLPQTHSIH
jgi:hypothetical protein